MYREVKGRVFKDYNPETIAWEREDVQGPNQPLIYVFPQRGENIKWRKYFAVKDYEKVIFYDKGELVGVLGGGVYELEKKAKIKGTEIVWVDTSLKTIQWGVPQSNGIPTKDGIIVGIFGDLKLKINDTKIFYNDIVAGRSGWTVQDLKDWIMSLLQTSLRDIFKNYKAKEVLLEERERIVTRITSKLTEEFLRYGLNLETFNLLGIKPPEGTEKLYEVEREKERIADEMKISKMKEDLELQKMEFEATKKDLKRKEELLDAQSKAEKSKYLAETERIEGEVKTDLLEKQQRARVAGEAKLIETHGDKAVKIAEIQSRDKNEAIQHEITNLKKKLDEFDTLLAEGKISNDAYETRVNRIEKELQEYEKRLLR
ncbi:MAG: SPFH domain-containing protein [Promethearchaeota archaeon]|jgi:regulator of protease activity HflC (stomatin/prohibitin superfamily)